MLPDGHKPVHGVHLVDGQPTIVFGTVCTKDRSRWLAAPEIHAILRQVWSGADAWLLGRYVIMPDHVHFFAGWTGVDLSFDAWVRYWKSQVSKALQRPGLRWQSNHWDTRIRSFRAYEEKWLYVERNPVRHGLVSSAEEWPFRGQLHVLPWD